MVYRDGYTASDGKRKQHACDRYHDRQTGVSSDDIRVDFKADDEQEETESDIGSEG